MDKGTLRPNYYKDKHGKDLFSHFKDGLLNLEQLSGFYLGNIMKYLTRYREKNGVEDLQKAKTYLEELINLEGDKQCRKK